MSLFDPPAAPQLPQEDPSIKAERDRLQKQAEDDRIKSIQRQLSGETAQRSDLGTRSLLGDLGGSRTSIGAAFATKLRRSLLGVG